MTSLFTLRRTKRVSGAAYLAVSQTILVALGYVTHVLVGKIGGPPLYGVYGLVLSLMSIINMLLSLGIPVAASKEVAEDEANSGGVFVSALRLQLLFAVILGVATFLLATPFAALLGDSRLHPLIRFAALIFPATAVYALFSNYFNGLHAFAAQARLTVLYAVVKLAGSVGFLFLFRSVTAALSGFIAGGLAATAVGFLQAWPTIRGRIQRTIPPRRLFVFAGSFVGISIALQILMSLDLFLVKRFLQDNTLVGYYNAATTVARIPYFILQGLGFVFLPSVARLFKEDLTRARTFIRDVFRYLFLFLAPITALAATTSTALLNLFFSAEYNPAARPLTLLSIAFGFLSAFYLLSTIAAGAGRPKIPLRIAWTLIVSAGALGTLLIPRAGLEGAAIATLAAAGAGAALLAIYMYRQFLLAFPLQTFVRGTIAVVIAVLPTYFVTPPAMFLPVWYALLFAVYALTLIALGEVRREDWMHLKSLLPHGGRRGTTPTEIAH
ncbi:MAG: membrane protein involved in the export of O-antigen and teichoic acid [Parcubacteria group bacterium Gr01-1014_38]|nr:MAG: membrane protein involved in the export of O-antigen and teichoic acid [Parcubacteria group bacterium Gr01-1014_38]